MRTQDPCRGEVVTPATLPPAGGQASRRRRVAVFCALCVVLLSVALGYGVQAAGRTTRDAETARAAAAPAGANLGASTKARVLFQGPRGLSVVPLDDPQGPQASVPFECDRVDFAQGLGVCLTPRRNIISPSSAIIFDDSFNVIHTLGVPGLPSRVRLSPDGRWAAVTSFVDGHSYAAEFFSTKTVIIDVERGRVVHDLERFTVTRQGQTISEVDFNFWGVTFTSDNNRFYATLGTGGHRYLVEGDLGARAMKVLRDDVECPSLSPNGQRIAFKRRVPGGIGPVTWRLSVLDIESLRETPLAESASVDDQAEWLDNDQVLYGIRGPAQTTSTWSTPADGTGTPRLFIPDASSTVVIGE